MAVHVSGELPNGVALPAYPVSIQTILKTLEGVGKVNVTLPHHSIEPDGDTWKISCSETIALEVKAEPTKAKKYSIANLGGIFDLNAVLESDKLRVVPAFEYQVKRNRLVPAYPGIWPAKSFKIKNEDFVKLAGK